MSVGEAGSVVSGVSSGIDSMYCRTGFSFIESVGVPASVDALPLVAGGDAEPLIVPVLLLNIGSFSTGRGSLASLNPARTTGAG